MADGSEVGAEIRTMILELIKGELKTYRPKLIRARGVLPGKNLPTTGNTGTGYTPADESVTDAKLAVGAVILSGTKVTGILPSANGGTGINNGGRTLTIGSNPGTLNFTGSGKTLSIANSLSLLGTDGSSLNLGGNLIIGAATTISGGGIIALAGYTLTVPASGTAALLATANVFSNFQFFDNGIRVYRASTPTATAITAVGLNNHTDTPDDLICLYGTSSATTAAGFGSSITTYLQKPNGDPSDASAITTLWTSVAVGSEVSAVVVSTATGASLVERLRISSAEVKATVPIYTTSTMRVDSTLMLGGFTLTGAKTGTLPVGTGAVTRLAYWSDANELTSSANLTYSDPVLEFSMSSSATARGLTLTNAVAATAGGKLRFLKARGTVASPTSISSADQLGSLGWSGHDGGAGYPTTDGASITAVAAEAWGTGAHGAILRFSTTPIGSTTIAVRMLIDETGFVGIGTGTTTPAARLHVLESTAATNTVVNGLIISHTSSGTPAASFGTAIAVQGKSSMTNDRDMGRLRWLWATATDASRAGRGILSAYYTTTERDCIAWEADSSAARVGFLGATPAIRQTGGAATAGAAYTATEQGMIQKAYDALRTFGLLT